MDDRTLTLYSQAYIEMVNRMPEVLGWLYDSRDRQGQPDPLQLAFDKLNTIPFVRMLEKYQPDLAICTHFLPAEIIDSLRKSGKLTTRQVTVVTDFDIHSQWISPSTSHYFVAIDETRAHLEALGIPDDHISVTGIPIDPAFTVPVDQAEMRKRLGLELDRTTILISAGGFGVGKIDVLMQALVRLRHRAQVVAICGRNQELKGNLEQFSQQLPDDSQVRVHVVGYTERMHEYMAACDLIVGKPGGLTTSEALARGLVFIVVSPIPGQEERNSDHLLEEGAALRCNNLPTLAFKIDRLLDDSARLASMRKHAIRMSRPRAALDIVAKVNDLLSSPGEV